MPGNKIGGQKTAARMLARDPDWYHKIGAMAHESWVKNGRKPKGFAAMSPEKVSEAGRKGGAATRRKYKREPKT